MSTHALQQAHRPTQASPRSSQRTLLACVVCNILRYSFNNIRACIFQYRCLQPNSSHSKQSPILSPNAVYHYYYLPLLPPNEAVPLTPGICNSFTCFRPLRTKYSIVRKSVRATSPACRLNSFLACDVVVLVSDSRLVSRGKLVVASAVARSFLVASRSRAR